MNLKKPLKLKKNEVNEEVLQQTLMVVLTFYHFHATRNHNKKFWPLWIKCYDHLRGIRCFREPKVLQCQLIPTHSLRCFTLSIIQCSEHQKGNFDTLSEVVCIYIYIYIYGFAYRIRIQRKRFCVRPAPTWKRIGKKADRESFFLIFFLTFKNRTMDKETDNKVQKLCIVSRVVLSWFCSEFSEFCRIN